MYYACFYAIGALLAKHQIEVNSHPGVRQTFGEHFVKTGKFDKRLAKHFTELFGYDEESVLILYPLSKELIEQIDKLLTE